jgi:hypothetical protein
MFGGRILVKIETAVLEMEPVVGSIDSDSLADGLCDHITGTLLNIGQSVLELDGD